MLDGLEAAARNGAKREGELQDARLGLLTIADLTAIRNLIRGGSVIDWHRLYFSDRDQVDRFLRVHEFDPENGQEPFCMTVLGLKMSRARNSVSHLHCRVTRPMWRAVWPTAPARWE